MKWNKYTLTTREEAEDIISSMMMEVGIEGIEIEDKIPLTEQEKAQMFVDILPEMPDDDGVAYISFYLEPEMNQEEMLQRIRVGLAEISQYCDIGEGTITASETEDKDWINNWKQYFHQFYVDDILIKPTWVEKPEDDHSRMCVEIDPGTAFGTGSHETTQLCIRGLEKFLKKGDAVLDVGTGSGILGIVALKMGASEAFGTDIDDMAVQTARENIELNGFSEKEFPVITGDVISDKEIQDRTGYDKYDVAVANILADIIIPLQKEVTVHMKKGAILIVSGIINLKEEAVRYALSENPELEIIGSDVQGEWVAFYARKR